MGRIGNLGFFNAGDFHTSSLEFQSVLLALRCFDDHGHVGANAAPQQVSGSVRSDGRNGLIVDGQHLVATADASSVGRPARDGFHDL